MSLETDGEDELASISPTFKSPLMNPVGKPQFISDPSEDNKCSICQSVLVNAFQLRCGHHICQDDIKFTFEQNDTGKCLEQDCGEIFSKEDVFPDACKRREISNLAVYCPNKDLGCEEKLPWSGLATHEAICSYQERHCDKCSQRVRLSELEDHTSNTCEYREIPCEYCRERISIKNIEHHKNLECQHSPLGCPNGCGIQGILREEIQRHLLECPLRKIVCPLSKYGCTFEGTVEQMEAHKKEGIVAHMDMLLNKSITSNEQHESMITEMKVILDRVILENARIPQLIEENEKLQKEVKVNKMSIQEMMKVLASSGERVIQTGRKLEDKASVETVDKLKQEVAVLRDAVQESNKKMTQIERSGVAAGCGNPKVIQQVEKQVGQLDIRVSELDLRLQLQETINHDGVLMWKLQGYSKRKRDAISGKTLSLYSQPFYTSRYGYKLCGRIYLNGDGSGKGTHLSFFIVVMRGDFDALLPWPFQFPVTLKLLDQNGTGQHIAEQFMPSTSSNSFKRPTTEMNVACGVPTFASHAKLETQTYLKDDTMFLRVEVDCTNAQILC